MDDLFSILLFGKLDVQMLRLLGWKDVEFLGSEE